MLDKPDAEALRPRVQAVLGDLRLGDAVHQGRASVVYRAGDRAVRAYEVPAADEELGVEPAALVALLGQLTAPLVDLEPIPGVATIHGAHPGEGVFVVVEDWVEGRPLELPQDADAVRPTVAAVAGLHAVGAVHGGVRPSRVLLGGDGRPTVVGAGWAGYASTKRDDRFAWADMTGRYDRAEAPYVAPEQKDSEAARSTSASDVFALGALLYEARCKRPAYPEEEMAGHPPPPYELAPTIGEAESLAIERSIASAPADRPANAMRLLAWLELTAADPGPRALELAILSPEEPLPTYPRSRQLREAARGPVGPLFQGTGLAAEELLHAGSKGGVWKAKSDAGPRTVRVFVPTKPPGPYHLDPSRLLARACEPLVGRTFPGIATLRELQRRDGYWLLVEERVEGEALTIERREPADALRVVRALAESLTPFHAAGLIHGGIQPSRVLLAAGGPVLVGAGWGAYVASYVDPRVPQGDPLRDLRNRSPQQARGFWPKPACDVFALGVLLHELLSGAPLFGGLAVSTVNRRIRCEHPTPIAGVPTAWNDALARALAPIPQERFQNAGQLADALAALS